MSQNFHSINQVGVCFHYFINHFIKDLKKYCLHPYPLLTAQAMKKQARMTRKCHNHKPTHGTLRKRHKTLAATQQQDHKANPE